MRGDNMLHVSIREAVQETFSVIDAYSHKQWYECPTVWGKAAKKVLDSEPEAGSIDLLALAQCVVDVASPQPMSLKISEETRGGRGVKALFEVVEPRTLPLPWSRGHSAWHTTRFSSLKQILTDGQLRPGPATPSGICTFSPERKEKCYGWA